jgi:hypothetical protein
MVDSATESLARLVAREQELTKRLDQIGADERAAAAAVKEASERLVALERADAGGATKVTAAGRTRAEDELLQARSAALAPWRERQEAVRAAVRDAQAITRQFVDGKPIALDAAAIQGEPVIALRTRGGAVKIVPEPAGTRGGYDDLRRAASREPLGRGLRPLVASIGDLARMAAALGRDQDMIPLRQLRILADLDRGRVRGIER